MWVAAASAYRVDPDSFSIVAEDPPNMPPRAVHDESLPELVELGIATFLKTKAMYTPQIYLPRG